MRTILIASTTALLAGCALPTKMTPAEQEMADTMVAEAFQPATRELRDSITTQPILTQASFWSREYNLNPADLEATIRLASVVRRMGNPERAIEITQTTRALYPKDPYLMAELSAALIAAERGREALPVIQDGLAQAAGYARLWSLRGAALDQMGRYAEARASYDRALSITPYDPNILANVGASYALEGNLATAEEWLTKAAAIPTASEGVHRKLDLVREMSGKAPLSKPAQPQQVTPRAAAPQPLPQAQAQTQPFAQASPLVAPPSRLKVFTQDGASSAADAARMAAGQTRTQTVPLQASDPDALARLARNASPHTRGMAGTPSAKPQARSPFAPQQAAQSAPPSGSPQAYSQPYAQPGHPQIPVAPTGYTQGYSQAFPQGANPYAQPRPQMAPQPSRPRGPARLRR